MSVEEEIRAKSTSSLVIALQKLAKNMSYLKPWVRAIVLDEAAKRLTAYRQAERAGAERRLAEQRVIEAARQRLEAMKALNLPQVDCASRELSTATKELVALGPEGSK